MSNRKLKATTIAVISVVLILIFGLIFSQITTNVDMSNDEISDLEKTGQLAFEQLFDEGVVVVNRIWYDSEVDKIEKNNYLTMGRGAHNGIKKNNIAVLCCDYYEVKNRYDGTELDAPLRDFWTLLFIRIDESSPWTLDDCGIPMKGAYNIMQKESEKWDKLHPSTVG